MTLYVAGITVAFTGGSPSPELSGFAKDLIKQLHADNVTAHGAGRPKDGVFTVAVEVEADNSFDAEKLAIEALAVAARKACGSALAWSDADQWPIGFRTKSFEVHPAAEDDVIAASSSDPTPSAFAQLARSALSA
jgi:hypothetical protein